MSDSVELRQKHKFKMRTQQELIEQLRTLGMRVEHQEKGVIWVYGDRAMIEAIATLYGFWD